MDGTVFNFVDNDNDTNMDFGGYDEEGETTTKNKPVRYEDSKDCIICELKFQSPVIDKLESIYNVHGVSRHEALKCMLKVYECFKASLLRYPVTDTEPLPVISLDDLIHHFVTFRHYNSLAHTLSEQLEILAKLQRLLFKHSVKSVDANEKRIIDMNASNQIKALSETVRKCVDDLKKMSTGSESANAVVNSLRDEFPEFPLKEATSIIEY